MKRAIGTKRAFAFGLALFAIAGCSEKTNPDASAVIVTPAPAHKPSGGTMSASTTSPDDATKTFLEAAALADLYQDQVNQAASARSKSEPIKAFAQASADHYATLAKEMVPVGTSVGVLSPTALDEAYMAKLSQLTDANLDFEQTYRAQQQVELEADLQRATSYSESGANEAVRAFAVKRVAMLNDRIKALKAIPAN